MFQEFPVRSYCQAIAVVSFFFLIAIFVSLVLMGVKILDCKLCLIKLVVYCLNCIFSVPFEEDDKDPSIWFLDHNYHESMFSMFKRINGNACENCSFLCISLWLVL
jgi:hypothetical protein